MTRNYWIVRMGEYNKFAPVALEREFVAVGWLYQRDLSGDREATRREFADRIRPVLSVEHPERSNQSLGSTIGQLFRFTSLMQVGDVVLMPKTEDGVMHVGEIASDYLYEQGDNACPMPHRRKVRWIATIPLDQFSKEFRNSARSIMTTFSVSEYAEEIERFLRGTKVQPIETDAVENVQQFGLESHLEDFIVDNWARLPFATEYDIYREGGDDGSEGIVGKQYVTKVGRIDILARSRNGKRWLVIELKKGRPTFVVVGQTQTYMGFVLQHLAEEGNEVRGMIIAAEDDEKLRYALAATRDISFMTYRVSFSLDLQK